MKALRSVGILIVAMVFSGQVFAAPSIVFEDSTNVYSIVHNWYGDGTQWTSWLNENPYPGTQSEYGNALDSGKILGASLTVVLDDLDLGNTARLYVRDKNGVWHDEDLYGQTMLLNTMEFADCIFVHPGPGSPYEGHITETTLNLDPAWIGDEMALKLAWDGWSQIEVETSVLSIETQATHAPAPAALALGSLGVAMVGWLRRRRTI